MTMNLDYVVSLTYLIACFCPTDLYMVKRPRNYPKEQMKLQGFMQSSALIYLKNWVSRTSIYGPRCRRQGWQKKFLRFVFISTSPTEFHDRQ